MTSTSPKPDIETLTWIARTPEDIWNYLYDVSNEPQWRGGVKAAQWISDPPHGIGSTGLHVVEGMGDWPWRMTEWEKAAHHELGRYRWQIRGGSCRLSHRA